MKKIAAILTATFMLLSMMNGLTISAVTNSNPFSNNNMHYYIWDDLTGKTNKEISTSTTNNPDLYYYSGDGQTRLSFYNEKVRFTQTSQWQQVMLTTGRGANKLGTRGAEGFGCYISNKSSSEIQYAPFVVGNDYYQMNASQTAYLSPSSGNPSAVTSSSNGTIAIPAGFEGFLAVPFTSTSPAWGNVTAFEPGVAEIGYFCVKLYATFSQNNTTYIDVDNMFLYGQNATPYKETLVKGGSDFVPLDQQTINPFTSSNRQYFIWDDLSGVADMTIPLPSSGSNDYVIATYGNGSHAYQYENEKLKITSATDWKYIQLRTNHVATAAQTANAEGLGFYINNKCGKTITIMPMFVGANSFRLQANKSVRMVNMDQRSYEDTSADWGGVVGIPADFEGYVLVPISSLEKDGGGVFSPGTGNLNGFTINVYANFSNTGNEGRYVAFDTMFLYGQNLNTVTPNAVSTFFPAAAGNPITNTQTIAAPSTQGYNGNRLVGIDQFGRAVKSITGNKSNKQVGMFYWLWNGQPTSNGIYDMTKFMNTAAGRTDLFSLNSTTAPVNQPYFWGEPLFGYYNSTDEYVLRKQIEMLTLSGVDFVVFDATNAVTYPNVYQKMFKLMNEYQQEGWNVPKIAFYTHSRSIQTTRRLYYDIYKANAYPNLWYYMNGKPMIIAYTDIADDYKEAQTRSDFNYYATHLPTEIYNFFYFKYPQWPNEGINHANGVPYVEWEYPQPVHNSLMNVSVASQHYACMSDSFTLPNSTLCWGRGFDFNTNTNISADADKGTFFQSQWNQVIKEDPDFVFIDGWNEWMGYKINESGRIVFVDAFTKEFSRDIEPMKDGYEDAFYLQTISNLRNYKSYEGKNYLDQGKTINIGGNINQWDTGNAVYKAFGTTNYGRNAYDYAGINKYVQDVPRNNIQEVRVVNDANNIYMYIMCSENITAYDGSNNWMNVFIGTGEPSLTGWNGYKYVINRQVNSSTGKTTVTQLNSDFSGSSVGQCDFRLDGRILQISIPKSLLGLGNTVSGSDFYFKVADGVQNPQNIQNYYIFGKSLPMGRLSYAYDSVKPSSGTPLPNPVKDTNLGVQVYEDFRAQSNKALPLQRNEYFWEAPSSANFKMEFKNQRLLFSSAAANVNTNFMLHLTQSTSNSEEAIRGIQGVGFYVRNNTKGEVVLSPTEVGNHAFYLTKGKTATLCSIGGETKSLSDSNDFTDRASFRIPAKFEGYILFSAADFTCGWHSSCSMTAGNFVLDYFSLNVNIKNGCNEKIGESVAFDNMFFYGELMTAYKQLLIRSDTNPVNDTGFGIQYLMNLGTNYGAWITDSQNGNRLNYTYVQDGRKVTFTGGTGYNMIAFNLFNQTTTPLNCSAGSNVEGIGFYVENNTPNTMKLQPVIPNNSYSLLRTHSDYLRVDMQKRVTYCQSTPYASGGGQIELPAGFKGYILTRINTYGNWWYGINGSPFINQGLIQFGIRGSFALSGGTLTLSDVFVYGRGLSNDNMVVDLLPVNGQGQHMVADSEPYSYTALQRVEPFWKGNIMRNECVTLISHNNVISGKLLYQPKKILSVRDNSLGIEYQEGVDWQYDAATNSIVRLSGSTMPYFTESELTGQGHNDSCGATGQIGNALYCVGPFLYSKQFAVTYTYDSSTFSMPHTTFDSNKLPVVINKFKNNQEVKIAVYGDSIMQGCDASGLYNRAPYQPILSSLLESELERVYGGVVMINNCAVGGYTSQDGVNNMSRITTNGFVPDLVVLGFGQNDANITPAQSLANIQTIMNYARQSNPNVEFIILSTINANYQSNFQVHQATQPSYYKTLAQEHVAFIDINGIHAYLALRKNYIDMSGNNINHPNDFMIRVYAMQMLSVLINYT